MAPSAVRMLRTHRLGRTLRALGVQADIGAGVQAAVSALEP
jgi:hypothetical protein